jgi:DNA-binding SARP family transcriptional activator/tetratricopeptide (TPR) repeat protein
VIYRLLGNLEIGLDGQSLALPGGHNLVVLAALLVNANQRMAKNELLKSAWGSDEVSEAQLHKSAAALRALLAQIGRGDDLVTHPRQGYELRVSDAELDMLRFRSLLTQAEQARSEHRAEDEIALLREGLGLWRGRGPLSNVPGDAFRQEIGRLEQRRKRAAARLFDLELARRGYDRILDDLAMMDGYYPADGRLGMQLMIAQYRCGHVTDATAVFERYVAELAEQTGGEPDPELRALHYAIARGDEPAVAAAEAAIGLRSGMSGPAAMAVAAVPRQLPPDPADFVGRDDLVAEATWLLGRPPGRRVPVVVISGPGGIGKTALASRVAHRSSDHYPDGQLYMELRSTAGQLASTSEVLAQFLRALGVTAVPEGRAERVATYRTLLASRRVLVVLDDASDEAQIRDLIPANPACGVLITARLRLPEIAGAHHVPPLSPLSGAAARELFLLVCDNSGISLRAELDAVNRVVALCGGLPLALRIAGALRVHDHPQPTAELAARLARQGPDGFTYGELSVARTIGAGFDRLDDDARQLFLDFGLLQLPSFGLWTAAALGRGTGTEAAAALSQLAARQMLELAEPQVRYSFHELTREYAARRARAGYQSAADRRAVLARVYGALLTLARRAHARLYGGDFEVVHSDVPYWDAPPGVLAEVDADPVAWFEKERLNIRAAVSHCAEAGLTGICWDLAVSAHEFYTLGGYFDDWHATHRAALRACRAAGDRRGEGVVLACLGQPALVASRHEGVSGPAELERAASLLAECHERHGQAIALRTLANALRRRGQLARPLELFQAALGHYEASGDTVGRWQTLRYIGQALLDLGRHDEALSVLGTAEIAAGDFGERRLIAQTRYWIGRVRLAVGDLAGARAAFSAVLEVYAEPAGTGHAYAVLGLAGVAQRTGDFTEAARYVALAADLAHDGADAVLEGRAHLSAAELHTALGQQQDRLAALQQAVACFAGCGAVYLQAKALGTLASAQEEAGNGLAARAAWADVAGLYREMELPEEDRIYREQLPPSR